MTGLRWACIAACLLTVVGTSCKPQEPSKLAVRAYLEFGASAVGVSRVRTVVLANEGGAPLTIHGVTATGASVEVSPLGPFELEAGATRELEVRFTPDMEGVVRGELEVRSDASNVAPSGVVRLKVAGVGVKSLVQVQTESLDFGARLLGESRELKIQVNNPMKMDSPVGLELTGVDADQFTSSETRTALMLKPGEVRQLPVRFEPKRLGEAHAIARVAVCPTCEPVDVPLSGKSLDRWLEVTPARLDFGHVARGAFSELRMTVRNLSSEPMVYGGVKLLDNESGAFRVAREPTLPAGMIAPGVAVEVWVAFMPTTTGPVREARLELDVDHGGSTPKMGMQLPLTGEGGASCLVSEPHPLDFGTVAENWRVSRMVYLTNQCGTGVLLRNLKLEAQRGGDFNLEPEHASLSIPAGHTTSVPITFQPRISGTSEARLTFELQTGHTTSTEGVRVLGTGQPLPACQYELEPATMDFGQVPVGAEVTLGVAVRNLGTSNCHLMGPRLASGGSPSFSMNEATTVLAPGKRAMLHVRFKPDSQGEFIGQAEVWLNHPSAGHLRVPLHGRGVQGCFFVLPTTLDFGVTRLSCGSPERELIVHNRCSTPTTLTGLRLEGDAADFQVTHGFHFPAIFPAYSESRLKVAYAPRSSAESSAALRFDLGTSTAYTVGMVGKGQLESEQTDSFIQHSANKVDVLFVVDNSGSMMDEQEMLGANFSAFIGSAFPRGVDFHIAVTTTGLEKSSGGWAVCPGSAEGGENGRFFPVDNSSPRLITRSTPEAAAVFARNTHVGVCHWNEQGLEAMYRALSDPLVFVTDDPRTPLPMDGNAGFLREDARLAVIVVSDEEDFSLQPAATYETFLLGLKGGDRSQVIFSAIVGPEDLTTCPRASSTGSRYIQLARSTGGVVESICTPDWAASLERISESTLGPNRSFPLSEVPSDTSLLQVRVDGVEAKSGWTYDPAANTVRFEKEAAPPPGASVRVTYPVGC
ncbi:flagellar associated PapD-like protein [Archangium gephyra]|uniref:Flagellar associated PapD-like protein n=1 Tax=Archangium gephyra TaxID=48 RepID=A0AAC8QC66_9BACT|nr:choice-of-anchor D domain-containing protein [Archangium gephyra]AKJ04709.1 putative lipoprotein [Archangium gephyra]REG37233.1 flagellar associated PapD-like protein [Archangium gephyra]